MLQKPKIKYRKDYQKPDYLVDSVELTFFLDKQKTKVVSRLKLQKNYQEKKIRPILLNGEDLKLLSLKLNDRTLSAEEYQILDDGSLLILNPPSEKLELQIENEINPESNTKLSGLYISGDIFCTQCEAEGFRRITYFPDRPDIMAKFRVTIYADRTKYPVMLSNGNMVKEGENFVVWEDPFPKSSYLFALVAGDLAMIEDTFITLSGKSVTLRIYAQKGKENRLEHAMKSLKKAFAWDEKAFGREYDLNLFNLVAVSDFNMGAMENKSLNIFNDKLVLANPETATDTDYMRIESVIAHEYFHNWSGDRVTARDWFNLSLKEGFTVYREQEFSADMNSRALQRINDVLFLWRVQFPEDAGPLAHPVRPESYMEIDNFYTSTVYEKGAELIRMQEKILGKDLFRKATDLYFSRHDGQAVTIDDFVKCMEDASNIDLSQFKRWYSQAGTPEVEVKDEYNPEKQTYTLFMTQKTNPTPMQEKKDPLFIPIEIALLNHKGEEIPLILDGDDLDTPANSKVLILDSPEKSFVFKNIQEKPLPSLNRSFTAPINIAFPYTDKDLVFLMAKDTDPFIRWSAGQKYALQYIKSVYQDLMQNKQLKLDNNFNNAFASYLDIADDKMFAAMALQLPSLQYLFEQLEDVDIDILDTAFKYVRDNFVREFKSKLLDVYHANYVSDPFDISASAVSRRALRNRVLAYLATLKDEDTDSLVREQYRNSVNMTDVQASLAILLNNQIKGYEDALGDFYWHFKKDPLVVNKWLMLQAGAEGNSQVLAEVKKLTKHEAFNWKNPNKVYALIGAFSNNFVHFHAKDGSGYDFLADTIIHIDAFNPLVASHVATFFGNWRKLDEKRRKLVEKNLNKILNTQNLSKHVWEIVSKSMVK